MRARMRWVSVACGVLLAGAGLGFVARGLLGLERPVVAIAWVGSVAAELGREREPRPRTLTATRVDDAVRRCRLNAGHRFRGHEMRERLERELAQATAELKAHMASWEYAFAMGSSRGGGREHPLHWATRARTEDLMARCRELRAQLAEYEA